MRTREAKWNREQKLFDSLSANVHITDSESEDSDAESDDGEDLDHSVVALDEGTV